MEEIWRPIALVDGRYEVSDWGRIRRARDQHVMALYRHGGQHVCERRLVTKVLVQGKRITLRAHRCVAEAFLGPCPNGMEVDHVDGDPFNNRRENLEYVTHEENMRRAASMGRHARGERAGPAKLTEGQVREIEASPDRLSLLARRYGVHRQTIRAIKRHENWKHLWIGPMFHRAA